MTPAAYPRVLLCDSLRHRRGSAPAFANALIEPGRLSPPIWPCTTRGFPCSRYCYRDGGLLPHLFTLAKRTSFSKTSRRFPYAMPPCCCAGGIFSVALSVTEPHRAELNSTPPIQVFNLSEKLHFAAEPAWPSPGVTRRVAHPLRACTQSISSADAEWCPDFPPAPIARSQRSPGPSANFIIA